MKEANKKFFVLGMTLLLSLSLILGGCGSQSTKAPGGSDNTKAVDSTPDVLNIGGLYSMTGPVAALGVADKQGTEMAVEEVNNAGGLNINGKKVKVQLTTYDIGDDPAKAIEFTQRLVNLDKVKIINGPEQSPQIAGTLKITDPAKVLVYNGIASTTLLTAGAKYGLNIGDNGMVQMHSLIQLLTESADSLTAHGLDAARIKKVKKVVFFGRNETYSQSMVAGGKEAAQKVGIQFDSVLYPPGTTDFLPYVNKLKALKPDAVVFNAYSLDIMIPPIKDMLQVGGLDWTKGDIILMGTDLWSAQWFIDETKKQGINLNGVITFSTSLTTLNEKVNTFNKKVTDKYGKDTIATIGFLDKSYDATMTMLKGIEASGTIVDADKMLQGIKTNIWNGLNIPMKILDQRQLEQPEYILTVKNDKTTETGYTYKSELYYGTAFTLPLEN